MGTSPRLSLSQQSTAKPRHVHAGAIRGWCNISSYCYGFHNGSEAVRSFSRCLIVRASLHQIYWIRIYTNTLARASAPALPINALEGWKATSYMDSSDFFRWEVTSCTHVLLSRFHSRIEQSWPVQDYKVILHIFKCFKLLSIISVASETGLTRSCSTQKIRVQELQLNYTWLTWKPGTNFLDNKNVDKQTCHIHKTLSERLEN